MPRIKVDAIDRRIGKRIKETRQAQKLSQGDLGRLLGISYQQMQKYEAGENRITASALWRIAKLLKSPIPSFYPAGDVPSPGMGQPPASPVNDAGGSFP